MAQPTEGVLSSEEFANTVQSSNVHALLKELEAAHALIRGLQDEKTRRTNGSTHHTWGTDFELSLSCLRTEPQILNSEEATT